MRRTLLAAALLLTATAAFAFDEKPAAGTRIGVLTDYSRSHASRGAERAGTQLLPKYLVTELRKAGYDAHVINGSFDELHDGRLPVRDELLLEVAVNDGYGENIGGVGVGGRSVGAEVSVVSTHLRVELRLYDARSFELLRTLDLGASSIAPAITGVGIGDWRSFLFFQIPIVAQAPYRVAAHAIAKDAVEKISRTDRD